VLKTEQKKATPPTPGAIILGALLQEMKSHGVESISVHDLEKVLTKQ
jgi:hypothetical protein